jgi:hypothetical protein
MHQEKGLPDVMHYENIYCTIYLIPQQCRAVEILIYGLILFTSFHTVHSSRSSL